MAVLVNMRTFLKLFNFFTVLSTHVEDFSPFINNFSEFKDKIIYVVSDEEPDDLIYRIENGKKIESPENYRHNAIKRIAFQRNILMNAVNEIAYPNDFIFYSDNDEIPNMESFHKIKETNDIVIFEQKLFYYKFNLLFDRIYWYGTKAVKKRKLKSPQWLRNVKNRKYPFYRIDTILSDKKYTNIKIIDDGGWHFTNMKTPKMIQHKLKSYLHHREFDEASLSVLEINELVKKKQALYDLRVDKRNNKVGNGLILENFEIKNLPSHIFENINKYKNWLDL